MTLYHICQAALILIFELNHCLPYHHDVLRYFPQPWYINIQITRNRFSEKPIVAFTYSTVLKDEEVLK